MPVETTYSFDTKKFSKAEYKDTDTVARLFNVVCIQGVSTCSRSCSFCPANSIPTNTLADGIKFMSDDVFKKIIADLKAIKYSNAFAMYLYSEPLLDPNYEEKIAYVRKELPKVKINVYTNGYSLTPERMDKLFSSGVNFLWLNGYTEKEDAKLFEIVEQYKKTTKHILTEDNGLINMKPNDKVLRFKRAFMDGRPTDSTGYWNNRGGVLTGKNFQAPEEPIKSACTQPFRQIFIDWEGYLRFCCSSWHPQKDLGSVMDQHILELWNSVHLHRKRKALINKNRNVPECKGCSYKGGAFKGHLVYNEATLPNETHEQAAANLWKSFGKDYHKRPTVDADSEESLANHEMDFATLVKKKRSKGADTTTEAVSDIPATHGSSKGKRIVLARREIPVIKEVELIARVPLKTKEQKQQKAKKKVWKDEEKMSFKNMNSMGRLKKRGMLSDESSTNN